MRVASYLSIHGAMAALEDQLKRRFPPELSGAPVNGRVQLIGSEDFRRPRASPQISVYLHRVEIDDANGKRWRVPPPGDLTGAVPELPVELHFLLVSWAPSAIHEAELHAWGFSELAAGPRLTFAELSPYDPHWREDETAHVQSAEMSTEDLFKIWDALPGKYTLSSAWHLRGVRVALPATSPARPALSRLFGVGDPR